MALIGSALLLRSMRCKRPVEAGFGIKIPVGPNTLFRPQTVRVHRYLCSEGSGPLSASWGATGRMRSFVQSQWSRKNALPQLVLRVRPAIGHEDCNRTTFALLTFQTDHSGIRVRLLRFTGRTARAGLRERRSRLVLRALCGVQGQGSNATDKEYEERESLHSLCPDHAW